MTCSLQCGRASVAAARLALLPRPGQSARFRLRFRRGTGAAGKPDEMSGIMQRKRAQDKRAGAAPIRKMKKEPQFALLGCRPSSAQ